MLGKFIECGVSYLGEGTPHFARKIIDGEEFVFIANIESAEPIRGVLRAYGREKEILLYPGDIRYMSASYDDIPEPEPVGEYVCALPAEAEAEFLSPNIVPLERFTYGGDVVIKTDEAPALYFDFSTDGKTGEIELFMPLSCKTVTESVALDGIELTSHAAKVFDEVISEKECTTPER